VAEGGYAPSFELVFELLDLPEKQNAARLFATFAA
jgi:hypothetical protein